MTEEEYRQEWLKGLHNTDYNNCRFAEDKIQFAKDWIKEKLPAVNLENPQNIVDIINWCKIYDMNELKPLWADKIKALDLLKEKGMNEIIIQPVYSKYCEKFTIEDYNQIPNGKWIFKCNHGSGWNMKFEKKDNSDPTYLIEKLNEWLSLNYAYISGWEWHYDKIPHGVIVQPDLGQLLDWQFWCENGEIQGVQLSIKLGKNLEEYQVWCDENGERTDYIIGIVPMQRTMTPSRKVMLEKIKPYVKELAQDFKFVRVDFYYKDGQPLFGEMTFTPCSGCLKLIT